MAGEVERLTAELARVAAEKAKAERLARLGQELAAIGAERKALRDKGLPYGDTMTRLEHKINEASNAGMGQRTIAELSGVARKTVRVALGLQTYRE